MPNTIERDHQMIRCFLITNTRKLIAKTGRRISCVKDHFSTSSRDRDNPSKTSYIYQFYLKDYPVFLSYLTPIRLEGLLLPWFLTINTVHNLLLLKISIARVLSFHGEYLKSNDNNVSRKNCD